MDEQVLRYVGAIAAEHRPLFDRLHALILQAHPEAKIDISYGMPRCSVGGRRIFVGAWRHGISIYGWPPDRDAGFAARHPALLPGKRTIRFRPEEAARIPDDELRDFLRAALRA